MAHVRQVGEGEAEGPIGRIFDAARKRTGEIAHIIRVMSLDGPSTQASMQFYMSLMKRPNALTADKREMLAAVVSCVNDCYYWTLSHARDFGLESNNEKTAKQLILDYRDAELSVADRALCDYAVKLTLSPGAMSEADVEILRGHGFSDDTIVIATQVISYFNYINRIADGLGVDDEDWMADVMTRAEWLQRKRVFV